MSEKIKLQIELTKKEAQYLLIEMNTVLRQYGRNYNGKRFDNEDMGNAFNKIYKTLGGSDHENYIAMEKEKKRLALECEQA